MSSKLKKSRSHHKYLLGDLEHMSDRVRLTQQMAQGVPGGGTVPVRER